MRRLGFGAADFRLLDGYLGSKFRHHQFDDKAGLWIKWDGLCLHIWQIVILRDKKVPLHIQRLTRGICRRNNEADVPYGDPLEGVRTQIYQIFDLRRGLLGLRKTCSLRTGARQRENLSLEVQWETCERRYRGFRLCPPLVCRFRLDPRFLVDPDKARLVAGLLARPLKRVTSRNLTLHRRAGARRIAWNVDMELLCIDLFAINGVVEVGASYLVQDGYHVLQDHQWIRIRAGSSRGWCRIRCRTNGWRGCCLGRSHTWPGGKASNPYEPNAAQLMEQRSNGVSPARRGMLLAQGGR